MSLTFDHYVDKWMSEEIDFGGEIMSRASIYKWFEDNLYPRRCADLWIIGYENRAKEDHV